MKRFVIRSNIEHFRRLLTTEMDGARRRAVVRLLAEEEAKLAALEGPSRDATPHGALKAEHNLDEILGMAMAELGAGMGNIQVLDRNHHVLFIAAQRGFGRDFLDHFRIVSADDTCSCGAALRDGKRIIVEDIEAEEQFASMRSIAQACGFRAVQSTPLIGRDNAPVGMLSTHFGGVHRPSEDDFNRLQMHAERAIALIESGCWHWPRDLSGGAV